MNWSINNSWKRPTYQEAHLRGRTGWGFKDLKAQQWCSSAILEEVEAAEVDMEVVAEYFQTLAEFTSAPLMKRCLLRNGNVISRKDFASNTTIRDTVFSSARS
jgi:hypothetical protein